MDLFGFGVVEKAEHVTTNASAAWLGHVEPSGDCDRGILIGLLAPFQYNYRSTKTHSAVSALLQDAQATISGQWLRAGHNALCTVNDTTSAWESDELWVRSWIEGVCIQRHRDVVKF